MVLRNPSIVQRFSENSMFGVLAFFSPFHMSISTRNLLEVAKKCNDNKRMRGLVLHHELELLLPVELRKYKLEIFSVKASTTIVIALVPACLAHSAAQTSTSCDNCSSLIQLTWQ